MDRDCKTLDLSSMASKYGGVWEAVIYITDLEDIPGELEHPYYFCERRVPEYPDGDYDYDMIALIKITDDGALQELVLYDGATSKYDFHDFVVLDEAQFMALAAFVISIRTTWQDY